MSHSIQFGHAVPRQLRRVAKFDLPRIHEAIDGLAENPFAGVELVGNLRGQRRLLIGDWRVIYEVRDDTQTVLILHVVHRSKAYRRRTP